MVGNKAQACTYLVSAKGCALLVVHHSQRLEEHLVAGGRDA